MAGIDATNPNLIDPQISNGVMHNPGNHVDAMNKMHKGNQLLNNPQQFDDTVNSYVSKLSASQQESSKPLIEQKVRNYPGEYT